MSKERFYMERANRKLFYLKRWFLEQKIITMTDMQAILVNLITFYTILFSIVI